MGVLYIEVFRIPALRVAEMGIVGLGSDKLATDIMFAFQGV